MVKAVFVRTGKFPCNNRMCKGKFVVNFDTISELTKYAYDHRKHLRIVSTDMNNRQKRIYRSKYNSISRKQYLSSNMYRYPDHVSGYSGTVVYRDVGAVREVRYR